jgi:hypothetical protein
MTGGGTSTGSHGPEIVKQAMPQPTSSRERLNRSNFRLRRSDHKNRDTQRRKETEAHYALFTAATWMKSVPAIRAREIVTVSVFQTRLFALPLSNAGIRAEAAATFRQV